MKHNNDISSVELETKGVDMLKLYFDILIEEQKKQNPDMVISDEKAVMVEVENFLKAINAKSADNLPELCRQWDHESAVSSFEVEYKPISRKRKSSNLQGSKGGAEKGVHKSKLKA